MTEFESPPPAPPPPTRPKRSKVPPILAAVAMLTGLGMLIAIRGAEARAQAAFPWSQALIMFQDEAPESDGESHMLFGRRLSPSEVPPPDPMVQDLMAELEATPEGRQLVEQLGLDRNEWIVTLDLPEPEWEGLLASGRLPVPGRPEVLSGPLARYDHLVIEGETFEVVGTLRRELPGLVFAYVMPDDPATRALLGKAQAMRRGWWVREGQKELDKAPLKPDDTTVIAPQAMTRMSWAALIVLALGLMAFGGAALQVRFLRWLGRRRPLFFGPVLDELNRWPAALWLVHIGYYGLFLVAMQVAMWFPLANLRLMGMIHANLYEGDLGFIGQAYLSGNILRAATMTFLWNYGAATVGMVIVPSFVPVLGTLIGLAKTALSFGMVGFGMSPLWIGSAEGYTYHSITMVLELEAYVIAAFVIVAYAIRMGVALLAVFRGRVEASGPEFRRGITVMAGGTVLVGIMLAIAALYEATSLILMRMPG